MTDQQTPEAKQCSICLDTPPYLRCCGKSSCALIVTRFADLELRLREAEAAREDWKRYSDNWERSSREKEAALAEALEEIERLRKDPSETLSEHPGCVYCMEAGTPIKDGEVCPKCGDRLPTKTERQQSARIAELEKDAARYRWMRSNISDDMQWYFWDRADCAINDPEHFDAAIDAALERNILKDGKS